MQPFLKEIALECFWGDCSLGKWGDVGTWGGLRREIVHMLHCGTSSKQVKNYVYYIL